MTPPVQTQLTEERWLALALARLREGTEILRTGGGTTLTADQCRALVDEHDRLANVIEAARLVAAWGAGPHEDDPPETIGVWYEDLARLRAALSAGPATRETE